MPCTDPCTQGERGQQAEMIVQGNAVWHFHTAAWHFQDAAVAYCGATAMLQLMLLLLLEPSHALYTVYWETEGS